MFELMKIVGLSAVLSVGFVTASEMQGHPATETASGKIYHDRVPEGASVPAYALRITYAAEGREERQEPQTSSGTKGDSLRPAPRKDCTSQAWPNISSDCLRVADGAPIRKVRMITVEQREGANTSVLLRVPAEIAQR